MRSDVLHVDERWVKAAVLTKVREAATGGPLPLVTAELTLGSSGIRADLGILAEDFIGIEIKTARDSLRRLSSQIEAYQRYFDYTVLVVSESHLNQIDAKRVGSTAIWVFEDSGDISEWHQGSRNHIDLRYRLDLLTQKERRRLLSRSALTHLVLANETELGDLFGNHQLAQALRERYSETSQSFWESTKDRAISSTDLKLLSRFADARTKALEHSKHQLSDRQKWVSDRLSEMNI